MSEIDSEVYAEPVDSSVEIDISPSNAAASLYNWKITNMGQEKIDTFISSYESNANDFMALLPPGGTIFELGSGFGVALNHFQQSGFNAKGVDFSSEAVKVAMNKFPNIDIKCQDIVDVEIEAPVDGVYERLSLMNLSKLDILKTFEKIYLALSPKGLFQCSFEIKDPQYTCWYFYPTTKEFIHEGNKARVGQYLYLSYFLESELGSALRAAHFKVLYVNKTDEPGIAHKVITALCTKDNKFGVK